MSYARLYAVCQRDWTETADGATYSTGGPGIVTVPLIGTDAVALFSTDTQAETMRAAMTPDAIFLTATFRDADDLIEQLLVFEDDEEMNCHWIVLNFRPSEGFDRVVTIIDFIQELRT